MAPKRKSSSSPKDEKVEKKGRKFLKDDCPTSEQGDDGEKMQHEGKIVKSNIDDKESFCSNLKKKTFSPCLLEENQINIKGEYPILELNQLLQKKSRINFQGSISWKIFLFPSLPKQALTSGKGQQFFGLDLVEDGQERTFWTHKATVWQQLFESVQDLSKTGQVAPISKMFNGILPCPVRAVPNGPNEIENFKSVKGQNIQHWIMLVPMPADIDSLEYIPQFLASFQALCRKAFIRSAYKSGVIAITKHDGLIAQISEEGNYWHVIDTAGHKDLIMKSHTCLSELLLDYTIKEVVSLMFNVKKDPSTWTETAKTFAYGN